MNCSPQKELSIEFSLEFGPNDKFSLGLSFSLDPFIQADKVITQYCNFSKKSLALKTENEALSGAVYRVKNTGPSTEPYGTPYESVTSSDIMYIIFTD